MAVETLPFAGLSELPLNDWRAAAKLIDHTLLKADATPQEIETLCKEARDNHFAAVCINPPFVKQCAELRDTRGLTSMT